MACSLGDLVGDLKGDLAVGDSREYLVAVKSGRKSAGWFIEIGRLLEAGNYLGTSGCHTMTVDAKATKCYTLNRYSYDE